MRVEGGGEGGVENKGAVGGGGGGEDDLFGNSFQLVNHSSTHA